MSHKLLLSTAIAYANGAPHIGHAFEFATADTLARYLRRSGSDVFFSTGMDEHGQKIEQKAREEGSSVQSFVDVYAHQFQVLDNEMSVEYDFFVRTSDKEKHYKGAQLLWNTLMEQGDLEKRSYRALYCVGCEAFKTEKDLNEKGECPDHLKTPDTVEEENYFFTLSKYTERIKNAIQKDEIHIIPDARKNEVLALLDRGLEDVSFSRPKSKVSWGVPVPNDDEQVMYVWCDALSNYLTAIGYGTDAFDGDRWSNVIHLIGKDILRFHAAIWPGMLLSAGLSLPKKILVHGHITSGGHKMSKSIGNVIDPRSVIDLFVPACHDLAGEALRYVLLYKVPPFDDGDLTLESIKETYTAHLANGIGNLTNRIMKMAISNNITYPLSYDIVHTKDIDTIFQTYDTKKFLEYIAQLVTSLDHMIQEKEPFKVVKVDKEAGCAIIQEALIRLEAIASALSLCMPHTSARIMGCIHSTTMPEPPLFGRLQ
ncbi:MAG: hypothetical protein RLZZ308_560 [Candidatus Parcubacteria bacterium]